MYITSIEAVTQWLLYGNPKFARNFCLQANTSKCNGKEQCKGEMYMVGKLSVFSEVLDQITH